MKIFSTTVALAVMAIFISSAQAAINIKEATIENGQVFIAGKQAQRRAAISWEGVGGQSHDADLVKGRELPGCLKNLDYSPQRRGGAQFGRHYEWQQLW